jgi:predicted secreted protein
MTSAKAGFGATLTFDSAVVGEILELGGIRFERALIDVTNHASAGGYEENIVAAIIRTGEFAIKCNSVIGDAGQVAVKAAWVAKTAETVAITFPDGDAFSGSAIVTDYELVSQLEEQIIFNATFKWTGAVTETATLATAPSALAVTTATLFPAFAAGTYEYYGVSTGDTCTIALTFATSTAALYREGVYVQALVTETPSGELSLGADNTVTDFQILVSEASKGTRTYNIHISNAAE